MHKGFKFRTPVAAGLLGGLAAAWAMNQLMRGVALATGRRTSETDPQRVRSELAHRVRDWQQAADPTGEVADRLTKATLGFGLSERQRKMAGPVLHYAAGAAIGAVYAAAVERWPKLRAGLGVPFALAVWAIGDEWAVPALRLMPSPAEIPLRAHAAMFSSHIVYGGTLELVRRTLRAA